MSDKQVRGKYTKEYKLEAVRQERAVRPFVNLPLPKTTTDKSLAVDAMELACIAPRRPIVAFQTRQQVMRPPDRLEWAPTV